MRAIFETPRLRQAIVLAACLLLASVASGGTYKILHNFGAGSDGTYPNGPLLLSAAGNLYGVTANGGGSACFGAGCGTVFELAPQGNGKWTEQILYVFEDNGDGAFPQGNLVQDAAGDLYGIDGTDVGKPHGVFELMPGSGRWNLSLLWTKGYSPGLLLDEAGDIYGFFSADPEKGAIGELSPGPNGWTYTDLYDFCQPPSCHDGNEPESPLTWDRQGNLYGTMLEGGNNRCSGGCGVAFQMTPNGDGTWTYRVIHYFGSSQYDGQLPVAGLVVDAAGNAYGATWSGGRWNDGTVFRLTPSTGGRWKETILWDFPPGVPGAGPLYTLALDHAGALYGMAQGGDKKCGPCGVIFKLAPQKSGKWKYSVLHTFHGPEGADPYGVILDGKGNIFGTTYDGGKYGAGVAFEITP